MTLTYSVFVYFFSWEYLSCSACMFYYLIKFINKSVTPLTSSMKKDTDCDRWVHICTWCNWIHKIRFFAYVNNCWFFTTLKNSTESTALHFNYVKNSSLRSSRIFYLYISSWLNIPKIWVFTNKQNQDRRQSMMQI